MQITTEIIFQNIFLASIVLMVFSLPKMIILIIWSRFKIYVYEKGAVELSQKKVLGKPMRSMLPKFIINGLKDKKIQMEYITKSVASVSEGLKIPTIEAATSVFLMFISLLFLDFDSMSKLIIYALVIFLILAILVTLYFTKKYLDRVKPFFEEYPPKKNDGKNN